MAERLSYPDLLAASGCCVLHGVPAEAEPKLKAWQEQHLHPGERKAAIGGSWTYSYTPTGLGTIVKVSCSCGGEIDLTDYDAW
jgi:hypothetical protein